MVKVVWVAFGRPPLRIAGGLALQWSLYAALRELDLGLFLTLVTEATGSTEHPGVHPSERRKLWWFIDGHRLPKKDGSGALVRGRTAL